MKVKLYKQKELDESEIDIHYPAMTSHLKRVITFLAQSDIIIEGFDRDRQCLLPLEDILYIDAADRKTFLYSKTRVYESRKTIRELEQQLKKTSIIKVGKCTLLNINCLTAVKPYPNHRLLAELKNGEHIVVSRKYLNDLQDKIRSEFYA